MQDEILLSYRQDFNKYAKDHQTPHLERVFSNIGQQLGQKYKCTSVDPELRAASLREARSLLKSLSIKHIGGMAEQCVHQEYIAYTAQHTPPPPLPLLLASRK